MPAADPSQQMGYGSRAIEALASFYKGELMDVDIDATDELEMRDSALRIDKVRSSIFVIHVELRHDSPHH